MVKAGRTVLARRLCEFQRQKRAHLQVGKAWLLLSRAYQSNTRGEGNGEKAEKALRRYSMPIKDNCAVFMGKQLSSWAIH